MLSLGTHNAGRQDAGTQAQQNATAKRKIGTRVKLVPENEKTLIDIPFRPRYTVITDIVDVYSMLITEPLLPPKRSICNGGFGLSRTDF